VAPSDATEVAAAREGCLALNQDKSERGCPTPRDGYAIEVVTDEGELLRLPIDCGRNGCPHCRRRNVQVTASMVGMTALEREAPPTHAVLTTTRDWLPEQELRDAWKEFARRVRKHVKPDAAYLWVREFTQRGGTSDWRRTHYHSIWVLDDDEQAQAVTDISLALMSERAGAWSPDAHGWQRVWDAGGLARYMAGLIGHHLKSGQAPPPNWNGRRVGASIGEGARRFYASDARELRQRATAAVRDERLAYRLEQAMGSDESVPDGLPEWIWDEQLTKRLQAAREAPKPRIVRVPYGTWAK
jgi:hypothetical protein